MSTAHDFTLRLQELLGRERVAQADFLVALAAFDRRRLWLDLGYGSLFDFLRRELGLSKASAFFRMRAAGLIQRFPEVVEPLRDGRLCLTSVAELAKVLTEDNKGEVLPRFFLLSKREAKAVSAALRPDEAPPRRDVVTTVRVPVEAPRLELAVRAVPAAEAVPSLAVVRPDEPASRGSPRPGAPPSSTPPVPPPVTIEPLTAELNRVHVTVSRRFLQKLEAAQAALSHSHPDAGMEEILEAGLDLLLARDAKRKGLVKKPRREPRPSTDPGYVPAHVRRAVWERDGGKCQWPLASGGVCGSTRRVELDHVDPRALGGQATVERCRLLCDVHNDFAAREVYGDEWMDRFTRDPRSCQPTGPGEAPRSGT